MKKRPGPKRLAPRHLRFIEEYLKTSNASAAYRAAGYKSKTVATHASRLASSGRIKAEIDRRMRKMADRGAITPEEVVRITGALARADARDLVKWTDEGARLTPSHEISDETAMAISEITIAPDGSVRVKLADRQPALSLLAKVLGMTTKKLELTGKVTLEQLISESYGGKPATEATSAPAATDDEPPPTK